jgi:hypothetical protein
MARYPEDQLWDWLGRKIPWHDPLGTLETRYGTSIDQRGRAIIRVSEADSPLPTYFGQPFALYHEKLPLQLPPVKWVSELLPPAVAKYEHIKSELESILGPSQDQSAERLRACRWDFAVASVRFSCEAESGELEIDPGYRRELSDREFIQIERVSRTALWFPRKREDALRYTGGFFDIKANTSYLDLLRRAPGSTKPDEIRFGVPPENDVLVGLAGFEAIFIPITNIENLQLDMDVIDGVETHTLSVRFRPERSECVLLHSTLEDLSAVGEQLARLVGRPLTKTGSRA